MTRTFRFPRWRVLSTASILQASRFHCDVTVFRLNAPPRPKTGYEPALRRNMAEHVYTIDAAHNPEVAGSNPVPAWALADHTDRAQSPGSE
jgi:hypothetical protein